MASDEHDLSGLRIAESLAELAEHIAEAQARIRTKILTRELTVTDQRGNGRLIWGVSDKEVTGPVLALDEVPTVPPGVSDDEEVTDPFFAPATLNVGSARVRLLGGDGFTRGSLQVSGSGAGGLLFLGGENGVLDVMSARPVSAAQPVVIFISDESSFCIQLGTDIDGQNAGLFFSEMGRELGELSLSKDGTHKLMLQPEEKEWWE